MNSSFMLYNSWNNERPLRMLKGEVSVGRSGSPAGELRPGLSGSSNEGNYSRRGGLQGRRAWGILIFIVFFSIFSFFSILYLILLPFCFLFLLLLQCLLLHFHLSFFYFLSSFSFLFCSFSLSISSSISLRSL